MQNKKKFFSQALFADTFRGEDSTGLCLVGTDNKPYVYKRALAGYDFINSTAFAKLLLRVDPRVAIGHNRAATKGGITDGFAHPFHHGKIILAHNGTLQNHRQLKDGQDFPVDSEYIAYAFDKFGVEDTLKKIRGAFALTWYDTETNLFNVVRNEERELVYGINKANDVIMYASEGAMLHWLSGRNHLDLDGRIYYPFKTHTWYTIDPNTLDIKTKEVAFAPKQLTPWQKSQNERAADVAANTTNKHSTTGTTGTPVTTTRTRGPLTKMQIGLADLGMEMGEEIFIEWSMFTPHDVAIFKLPDWAVVDSKYNVVIKDFITPKTYIQRNGGSIFSAKVRGCKHVSGSLDYELYITDTRSEEEDLNEKKSEQEDYAKVFRGPKGIALSEREWEKRTGKGCDNCGGPITKEDSDSIEWSVCQTPFCPDCVMLYHLDQHGSGLEGLLE